MLTVLSVIGTRPEAIKMAPVIKVLERHPERIRSVVCSTGQHRELLDQVLGLFDITPDYDLNLMTANQGLAQLTARLFSALDDVLERARPDCVLAQGDTTTVLVASLVSYYRHIPFGHVEAGLRTGDKRRPFPEEINRRLADVVSDLYFAPTERSRRALLAEGCPDGDIVVTGNTVIDALLEIAARPYAWASGPLARLPEDARFVLITAHRRESFGEQFRQLCFAIRDLAREFAKDGVRFVYPVHLNPTVRAPVGESLSDTPTVTLMEPLD
ncbi:MAG: non-hydrolyzing UDP-N-acetylglucosamine 2-epimerase, partial [Ktedonobacterales bacterium]